MFLAWVMGIKFTEQLERCSKTYLKQESLRDRFCLIINPVLTVHIWVLTLSKMNVGTATTSNWRDISGNSSASICVMLLGTHRLGMYVLHLEKFGLHMFLGQFHHGFCHLLAWFRPWCPKLYYCQSDCIRRESTWSNTSYAWGWNWMGKISSLKLKARLRPSILTLCKTPVVQSYQTSWPLPLGSPSPYLVIVFDAATSPCWVKMVSAVLWRLTTWRNLWGHWLVII